MLGQSLCFAAGIDQDKAQHFGAGVTIDAVEAVAFPKWTPLERLLGVAAIAGAQEWYDHNHSRSHSAESKDFAATVLGGMTAEGCVWLICKTW